MKIAIFGLGYVGSVSAACLAAAGHEIVGVDVEPQKLALIRQGRSPVTEPDLDEWLAAGVAAGRLQVTDDTARAVRETEMALICVGTPSRRNGSLDSTYLERVIEEIGGALAGSTSYYVVAVRSTLLPGVIESELIPLLERASGRIVGEDLGVCVNPEFLREGSAIRDFKQPPFTIVGETDPRAGDVLLRVYEHLGAPVHRVRPDEASMVKYASNAYHALKVAFANEIGALSERLGIDGRSVMKIFCEDRDLNISRRYLQPGFGFGGSCLPKDLRALNYVAKDEDLSTPLLASVLPSNDAHIQRVVDAILDSGKRRVALLGLSFKSGSDDLRESPFVTLAERLIGKGVRLRVCDPDVSLGQLVGRNRAYIDEHLPHVAAQMSTDWEASVRDADVVVIAKRFVEAAELAAAVRPDQLAIDLVGVDVPGAIRPWASPVPAESEQALSVEPARL
jgi:GDP-mannose 6-dehydrogenase